MYKGLSGNGWSDPLQQILQAGADYVTREATNVPTYGGAPAYPAGSGYYTTTPPVIEAPPMQTAGIAGLSTTATLALVGGAGLLFLAARR